MARSMLFGPKRVSIGRISLTQSTPFRLLPNEWLDVDLVDMYAELLAQYHLEFNHPFSGDQDAI